MPDAAQPPPAFPTEESLARQEADTTQLRVAIDELRQMLDVDTAPASLRPAPRRRRLAPLLWVLGVAVVAALIASAAFFAVAGNDDEPAPAATPPSPAVSESPAAGDPSLPPPLTPQPGTAPLSGPGVDEPGTLLVVGVEGDSTLKITEQAILADPATSQVPLVTSDVARLGGEIAGLTPDVGDLRAALDDTVAPVRATGAGRWFVPVSGEPRRIAVSYTVRGAVIPSDPSGTGRALVLVQPLLGRGIADQGLPLVVRTTGVRGRGASCPDAPAALTLCGQPDGKGNWTATVPRSLNPTVVLQLDLAAKR